MSTRADESSIIQPPNRRPSLRNLALKLGVSHTAIARALRDDPGLSEALRKRVQQAAREEGYHPSDVGKSLITGWSGVIGVVVPRLISPFVSALTSGIADALWEDDVMPLILCSQLDVRREEKMLKALASKNVGGVIIMPCREDRAKDHFIHLLKRHTPIVAINAPMPNVQMPYIASDDDLGSELATRHLIERGHCHIVYIAPSLDNEQPDLRRETGYRRVMKEAGFEPQIIHATQRALRVEKVTPILEAYLDSPSGRQTTAIFAYNDQLAFCVYAVAQRRGIALGQDLSLVGYGNTRAAIAGVPNSFDILNPTLSTVEQHPERWGRTAVEMLRRMAAGEPVAKQTLIEPELIVRASSSAAAAKND